MTLAKKLGKNLEQVKEQIQIRTISVDLGEVKFPLKVRVPLKKEMEDLNARIMSPEQSKIDAIYEQIAGPMRKTLEDGGEDFINALNEGKQTIRILEDDLIVDGTSLRQVAQYQAIEQTRIEEYFHLLVSETGEPVTESFDEISSEFPEFAIKEIVLAIQGAISPDYKTAKKN